MKAHRTTSPRKRSAPSLTALRSAVSNGSALLPDLDHRSAWARRLRDLCNDAIADLGGADVISSAEHVLIRRSAMLTLQLELMERRWATEQDGLAGPKSLRTYQTTTNTLRRVLETLGLKRRARDVTPSLREYLAARQAVVEDAELEDVS